MSNACSLPRRRSWGSFAFLSLTFTLAALLSTLLAILSSLRRTLGLNLLATFATVASPGAYILRTGLDVFLIAISFMFARFRIVLTLQICTRILGIDCSARHRRLFAMFNVLLVFLAFA